MKRLSLSRIWQIVMNAWRKRPNGTVPPKFEPLGPGRHGQMLMYNRHGVAGWVDPPDRFVKIHLPVGGAISPCTVQPGIEPLVVSGRSEEWWQRWNEVFPSEHISSLKDWEALLSKIELGLGRSLIFSHPAAQKPIGSVDSIEESPSGISVQFTLTPEGMEWYKRWTGSN